MEKKKLVDFRIIVHCDGGLSNTSHSADYYNVLKILIWFIYKLDYHCNPDSPGIKPYNTTLAQCLKETFFYSIRRPDLPPAPPKPSDPPVPPSSALFCPAELSINPLSSTWKATGNDSPTGNIRGRTSAVQPPSEHASPTESELSPRCEMERLRVGSLLF